MKIQLAEVKIKVPRDRNGEYEPQIIEKYNRNAEGMEEKIIVLYACGMSQSYISEQIKVLYDVEIYPELVSKISEKIMPEITAWQNRPLESVYLFVFWTPFIIRSRKITDISPRRPMSCWASTATG